MAHNFTTLSVPPGVMFPYGGTTAPSGWLLCEGALVSRTTYAALFTAVGTAWGSGDGSTTFALPDIRGQFLRGHANGSGNDPDRAGRTASGAGGATGDNVGSSQTDAIQGHAHTVPLELTQDTPTGWGSASKAEGSNAAVASGGFGSGSPTIDGFGTPRTSSEARPRNVNVKYIIKI